MVSLAEAYGLNQDELKTQQAHAEFAEISQTIGFDI